MATALARRPVPSNFAPRRGPVGISKAKAEGLARSAKAAGARAAKTAMQEKALMVAPISAAAFGAIEDKIPALPMGIPKAAGIGAAVAGVGAFMGGKMGTTLMLVGLGPLCAGARDVGRSFAGKSMSLAGDYDDVGGDFDNL